MQRVKDVEKFLADLERPLPGTPGQPKVVTEAELEADAESFMAFAKAFGAAPPSPRGTGSPVNGDVVVPSAPAS